nr:hypothetical protein [uncultured Mediterranean phage uvMED]
MATHDYVIANGTGAAVRSDLNNALAAIVSNNSSSSEPGTRYAYQFWADTNANVLKIRNAANDGWITLRELDGTMLIEDGSASTPGLAFADDVNTGIFSPAADQIGFATGGAERLEIGSSEVVFNDPSNDVDFRVESNGQTHMLFVDAGNDNVGVNSSNPLAKLHVEEGNSGASPDSNRDTLFIENNGNAGITICSPNTSDCAIAFGDPEDNNAGEIRYSHNGNDMKFHAAGSERMRIDSSGQVILNNSASSGDATVLRITGGTSGSSIIEMGDTADTDIGQIAYYQSSNAMAFRVNASEALRIDSSGNVSIGTTTAATNSQLTVRATSPHLSLYATPGNDSRLNMGDTDNHDIGLIAYANSDNSMRFTTNATERMRIHSTGHITIGKTSTAFGDEGIMLRDTGESFFTKNSNPVHINREISEGNLIQFYHDEALEGSISVSGNTVSYNGAHLARWSQLSAGAERTEILRGSVLSNLDEMCEWGEEDNEQLNRMKVSDVEGDVNVSGVFQAWDDDDDTYINDFYCAMTGDFVIRIAQGTTVARGDLLMSAGDGTAKPQDDDIVRSKTIAKVTSTTVSTTYADGSYCVPCVLMAC